MLRGSLTVVGTGMLVPNQCTVEARHYIETADIVFESVGEQLAQKFVRSLNKTVVSLQPLYGNGRRRLETYEAMVETILAPVREGKTVCAAFYGHAGVYAYPPHEVVRRARREGFDARMLPGVSADACLYADLGFDPGQVGCQSYGATDFVINARTFDPTAVLLLWQISVTGDRTYTVFETDPRRLELLSEVLMEHYPADHPVTVYCSATTPLLGPRMETVPLNQLHTAIVTQESTLYIPPLGAPQPSEQRLALLRARLGE